MPLTAADLKTTTLFNLEGKTAVLTGASGFLGRTLALALRAKEDRNRIRAGEINLDMSPIKVPASMAVEPSYRGIHV